MHVRVSWIAAALVALLGVVTADEGAVVVELKDGEQLEGVLLGFGERTFRLEVEGRLREVRESEVAQIRFVAPEPHYQARHAVPQVTVAAAQVGVSVGWSQAGNDHVLTTVELWRQVQGASWELMQRFTAGEQAWTDPDRSLAPRRYKVVSLAEVDPESPVVRRYRVVLPDDARRRESAPSAWIVAGRMLKPAALDAVADEAALRAVLADATPVDVSLERSTVGDALEVLRDLLPATLVSSPSVDRAQPLQLRLAQVARGEAVRLMLGACGLEIAPSCGVLYVRPASEALPERASGGALETRLGRRLATSARGVRWAGVDLDAAIQRIAEEVDADVVFTSAAIRRAATVRVDLVADALRLDHLLGLALRAEGPADPQAGGPLCWSARDDALVVFVADERVSWEPVFEALLPSFDAVVRSWGGAERERLRVLDEAINAEKSAALLIERGRLLANHGALRRAADDFLRASRLEPDRAESRLALARVYLSFDDLDRAEQLLRECERLVGDDQPPSPERLRWVELSAQVDLGRSRYDDAETKMRWVVEAAPERAAAHALLGMSYFERRRPEEALRSARRARALDPDDGSALFVEGLALLQLGRPDAALACLIGSTELNPDHAHGWVARSHALRALGRLDEAVEAARVAANLAPGDERVRRNLAQLERERTAGD